MEEDIKILEEFIEKNIKSGLRTELNVNEFKAIENLIVKYKELERENKILKSKQTKIIADSFHEKMAQKFNEEFIPKSKVKEKIEELINKTNDDNYWKLTDTQWIQYNYAIKILQELLD